MLLKASDNGLIDMPWSAVARPVSVAVAERPALDTVSEPVRTPLAVGANTTWTMQEAV
jgi:hypothetical protein